MYGLGFKVSKLLKRRFRLWGLRFRVSGLGLVRFRRIGFTYGHSA